MTAVKYLTFSPTRLTLHLGDSERQVQDALEVGRETPRSQHRVSVAPWW